VKEMTSNRTQSFGTGALIGTGLAIITQCVLLLLYCSIALAQDDKRSAPQIDFSKDPCGDPLLVSTGYTLLKGKAIEVIDGDEFVIALPDGQRKRIKLIGVEAPRLKERSGEASRHHLASLILNKEVKIGLTDFEHEKRKQITGLVSVASLSGLSGVNLEQLKAGMARYKRAGASLDWYQDCHYKRAEIEAHAAHRGLWKSETTR
jgi:endonuclease YncB( thermonuclease family)